MDKRIGLGLCVLVLALIGLTQCTSSDGGGASHGVDPSKNLNTLTQQEIDKICEDVDNRMSGSYSGASSMANNNDLLCTLPAVVATKQAQGTTADCESTKQECLQMYEQMDGESEADWEDTSDVEQEMQCRTVEELANCEATVSDIDACFNTLISEMKKAVNEAKAMVEKISCSNLEMDVSSLQDMGSDMPEMEEIPACQAVEKQCPGLMSESYGSSSW